MDNEITLQTETSTEKYPWLNVFYIKNCYKNYETTFKDNRLYKKQETKKEKDANGHAYVDLGLPSGKLWATMNVGANSPEAYGNYFMWGSVTPNDNDICDDSHRPDQGNVKYNNGSGLKELELSDDAAHVLMGGDWRMPTKDDFQELYDNTNSEWTSVNSINGRKFISKTDSTKFIFIPASGYRFGSQFFYQGSRGNVWSSALNSGYSNSAHRLYFGSDDVYPTSSNNRCYGYFVRGIL